MTDFGYVILATNSPIFMTFQACKVMLIRRALVLVLESIHMYMYEVPARSSRTRTVYTCILVSTSKSSAD